jgi:lysophospholipase L1-like esterase
MPPALPQRRRRALPPAAAPDRNVALAIVLTFALACGGEPATNSPEPLAAAGGAGVATAGTAATGGSASGAGGAAGGMAGAAPLVTAGSTQAGAGQAGGAGTGSGGGSAGGAGSAGAGPTPTVTPCSESELARCNGMPLACHFGGEPGNYEVTVQLGAGVTELEAEYYRRMLSVSLTAPSWFSFVTNVRVYEGEPLRPDQDSSYSKGIAGLDLYFRGPSPQPLAVCVKPLARPIMLWIEGDSTVTDQQSTEYAGWGQHLPQHFMSPISVANYADSGESSGSVLNSPKLWPVIKQGMREGDWVMVQVGHNDKTTSASQFRSNLLTMVNDAKAAKAHVILLTPISRAGTPLADQHVNSTGANLPQIIRDLGKSEGVPVIDLTARTSEWLATIDWTEYFANGTDRTHPNHRGADIISAFVREAVRASVPELAKHLR